jgi:hypothetical protein
VSAPQRLDALRTPEDPVSRGAYERLLAEHRALQARAQVDDRLQQLAADGAGLSALVTGCSELTGQPVLLLDSRRRTVAAAAGSAERPSSDAISSAIAVCRSVATAGVPRLLPAQPDAGRPRRILLTPVVAQGEQYGWLVVEERRRPLRRLDEFIARRVGERLGAEFAVQRRIARVAWNARSALARQLVHGSSDPLDLRSSAEYLGVDVDAPRICAYLRCAEQPAAEIEVVAPALERQLDAEVLLTRGSEGVLLLVAVPEDTAPATAVAEVKTALTELVGRLPGEIVVGVSGVAAPGALRRAYREAREVGLCLDRFATDGSPRVLTVGDLGPARLFLANGEATAVRQYVDDVLGPLLHGDQPSADLLTTLAHYFDTGRSIRTAAARLGVHENTVRLRLARVHTATGLDVAGDPNDQLAVQTALLVLRLQGHPVLSAVGPQTTERTEDTACAPS